MASSVPSSQSIEKLSNLILQQTVNERKAKQYAKVKNVLALIGAGAAITAAILSPGSTRVLLPLLRQSQDWDKWKHFNIAYLRRTLRRLESEKMIQRDVVDGKQIITLTQNGHRKIIKYSLESLEIETPKRWDNRWRVVLYDVPVRDKSLGDVIRQALLTLGFYPIQDSVYIFPYQCFDQVEFLREYYSLGDNVQYMLVEKIERDEAFKTYFHLT